MHFCKVCNKDKPIDEFYKSSKSTCKPCTKLRVKTNYNKLGNGYDSTFKGVIRVLYKTMKRHQKLRGHGELPFTKEEFKSWLLTNDFESIFNCWKEKGEVVDNKPSVDRLDDFKGYEFSNMRLVTWKDNRQHQAEDILTGKGTSGKRCQNINKLNKDGNVIKTYTSYQEIRREEGYCVYYPASKGYPCKKGFYWEKVG